MSATYSADRMRRGLLHFLGGRAVQALARALLLLLLVRLLPLADYGAYMLIVGLSEAMLRFASFGIVPVGQRFMPELVTQCSHKKLRHFCLLLIVLQWLALLLLTAVITLFWAQIAPVFGFDSTQAAASQLGLGLLVLVPAFRFAAELLETLLEQGRAQGLRALMPSLRLIIILALLAFNTTLHLADILLLDLAVTALCVALAYIQLARSVKEHGGQGDKRIPRDAIFRHARHMAVVDILGACNSPGAIRAVLAGSIGLNASALFAFLQSVERLVSRYLPGTLLRGLIRPMMIDRYHQADGPQWVSNGMNLLIKFNLLIVAAAILVVNSAGNEIVQLLSGDKFIGAGTTLLVMALALAISSQQSIVEMLMQITRQTEILRSTAFLTPVALGLIAMGVSSGLEAAVLVLASATAIAIGLQLRVLINKSDVHLMPLSALARIVLPALAGASSTFFALSDNVWVNTALSLTVFATLLLLTRPLAVNETALLNRGFGKKLGILISPFTHTT